MNPMPILNLTVQKEKNREDKREKKREKKRPHGMFIMVFIYF